MTIGYDPVGVGSDEMFLGRSGYLAGCLWLHKQLGREVSRVCTHLPSLPRTPPPQIVPEEKLFHMCDVIVESGRRFSR